MAVLTAVLPPLGLATLLGIPSSGTTAGTTAASTATTSQRSILAVLVAVLLLEMSSKVAKTGGTTAGPSGDPLLGSNTWTQSDAYGQTCKNILLQILVHKDCH